MWIPTLLESSYSRAGYELSQNSLSTKESLVVFGGSNSYQFVSVKEGFSYTEERPPSDHPDSEDSLPPNELVNIHFENSPEYSEHTFAVETVVDAFTKVAGWVTALFYVLRFLFGYMTEKQATKKMLKDLYEEPTSRYSQNIEK